MVHPRKSFYRPKIYRFFDDVEMLETICEFPLTWQTRASMPNRTNNKNNKSSFILQLLWICHVNFRNIEDALWNSLFKWNNSTDWTNAWKPRKAFYYWNERSRQTDALNNANLLSWARVRSNDYDECDAFGKYHLLYPPSTKYYFKC